MTYFLRFYSFKPLRNRFTTAHVDISTSAPTRRRPFVRWWPLRAWQGAELFRDTWHKHGTFCFTKVHSCNKIKVNQLQWILIFTSVTPMKSRICLDFVPVLSEVILSPLAAGTFFGVQAVFGLLTGSLGSSVQLAISMSNSGGAWDNCDLVPIGEGLKT